MMRRPPSKPARSKSPAPHPASIPTSTATEVKQPEIPTPHHHNNALTPPPVADDTLFPMQASKLVGSSLAAIVEFIASLWFDEHGNGPVRRFMRKDNTTHEHSSHHHHQQQHIHDACPTRRVTLFILWGTVMTILFLYMSEDEYVKGPPVDDGLQHPYQDDFVPVYVSWRNVGCDVDGRSHILSGQTGDARPGRITAILGASGSGKTTLAQALLGRARFTCTKTYGSVYLNGEVGSLDAFNDRVGFVPQDDVLYDHLTVEETLMFAAKWRLPRHLTDDVRMERVNETLTTLGLDKVRHVLVGSVKDKTLSGGQRKRVSIGMELVAKPSVVVLDEPTSGLDGASAFRLIRTLSDIALQGVSIVAVLHQPSARIFDLFDDLLLLQNGQLAYFGASADVSKYFATELGFQETDSLQIVDFLSDIVSGFVPLTKVGGGGATTRNQTLSKIYLSSDFFKAQEARIALEEARFRNGTFGHPDRHDLCANMQLDLARTFCVALHNMFDKPQYSQRLRPGVIAQTLNRLHLYLLLNWRRGLFFECCAVFMLATVSAFIKIFNMTWNRRSIVAFYVSVGISNLGMISAALEDEVLPVRRALDSGMMMGSHEFAMLFYSIIKSVWISYLYALVFFTVVYIFYPMHMLQPKLNGTLSTNAHGRTFCVKPFNIYTYFYFGHLLTLAYNNARSLGLLIVVLTGHDIRRSMVMCIGNLMAVHSFSLFTPTRNQIVQGGVNVMGKLDISNLVLFLCSFSYVRYFLEAITLWDPDRADAVGREYVLRYYGYHDGNEAACDFTLFGITTLLYVCALVTFALSNVNSFSASYDLPAFIFFLLKVLFVYLAVLFVAIVLFERRRLMEAWKKRRVE
jgi:ABC-type multidrug transport system ATPase subunit